MTIKAHACGQRKGRNGRRQFGGTQSFGVPCLLQRIQDIGVDSLMGEYNYLANIDTRKMDNFFIDL